VESRRLFLAVPVSEQIRDALANHLKSQCHGKSLPGRPAKPESWHFTLKFLGNVGEAQCDSLVQAMKNARFDPAFEVKFGSLGAFPRAAKATVLWIGVEKGGEQLSRLASTVEDAATSVGFAPENRSYHPHLTLSRIRPPQSIGPLLSQVAPLGMQMAVKKIVLYQSHLSREGARYQAVEQFALNT
jgi:2'-5' RNA ligase